MRSARVNSMLLANGFGQFAEVFLVGLGQDDPADAGAVGRQHLFLDAADGQDQTGQA